MQKYIKQMDLFQELFEKLSYESETFWATYTALMIDLLDETKMEDFWGFLLKHLRISDSIFYYSSTQYIVILEETTLRWAIILNDKLREKILEKWLDYNFYCSATQWNFIDNDELLKKTLKKRLNKAKRLKTKECVYTLSNLD